MRQISQLSSVTPAETSKTAMLLPAHNFAKLFAGDAFQMQNWIALCFHAAGFLKLIQVSLSEGSKKYVARKIDFPTGKFILRYMHAAHISVLVLCGSFYPAGSAAEEEEEEVVKWLGVLNTVSLKADAHRWIYGTGTAFIVQTYANAINSGAFCKQSAASYPLVTVLNSKWF